MWWIVEARCVSVGLAPRTLRCADLSSPPDPHHSNCRAIQRAICPKPLFAGLKKSTLSPCVGFRFRTGNWPTHIGHAWAVPSLHTALTRYGSQQNGPRTLQTNVRSDFPSGKSGSRRTCSHGVEIAFVGAGGRRRRHDGTYRQRPRRQKQKLTPPTRQIISRRPPSPKCAPPAFAASSSSPRDQSVAKVTFDLCSNSDSPPFVPGDDAIDGINNCGDTVHLVGKLCSLANKQHFGSRYFGAQFL
jgi:hypothetical protein